jgi:acyl transferase domain-containing protein
MRIFHEIAWEALEDAGYVPGSFKGAIGLYAGAAHNHYWIGLSTLSGKSAAIGKWAADQLIDKGYLTVRISYKLNLKGPSYTIYTACSTSLVAVHLACQAILSGECDMALAGGITIVLPQRVGYVYQEGMIMSPDGHCRSLDNNGTGTLAGEGTGIVVLKRLEDASADNDHIYAIIKGTAINNDGIRKSGFTAPSVEGQVEVLRTARQMARIEPESISYIEAHATGTTIGDPIEMEALTMAFNTSKRNYCAVGSIKSNIGHLDAAAGIAGFIKTVLALKHRMIPPSLHFTRPNPEIDFENSPFYVNAGLKKWENDTYPLRAGVSSFGIGGTNAHVILEEAPGGTGKLAPLPGAPVSRLQLILLSAKTQTALETMTTNLVNHLKEKSGINLADAAYTLQVGREAFIYRKMTVISDINDMIRCLAPTVPAVFVPGLPGT